MYDNEIYDHDNNRSDGGRVTGNFSGASTAGFESSGIGGTAYFNDLDNEAGNARSAANAAAQTAQPQATASQTAAPTASQTAAPTASQVAASQAETFAGQGRTAQTAPSQTAAPTASQVAASQAAQPQSAAAQSAQPRTAAGTTAGSTARTSTWTQAPVQHTGGKGEKPEHEEKKMGLGQKIMLSISLGLFFGIFAGIGFYGVTQAADAVQRKTPEIIDEISEDPQTESEAIEEDDAPLIQQAGSNVVYTSSETNVSEIVKNVMPAMVSIINNYTEVSNFWGQTYREELSSSGSGIIVSQNDDELLIVTNQHVVSDAEQLLVTLIDETEVEAKIKGMDADMDLAVIAINLEDLSDETKEAIAIANLGDSDSLELGERVIAIGNALGYGQSVTVGYISALDREIELEDGSVRSFIQTDAAINPGNSGGALLNAAGEVIGINSNKIGGTSIEGMGYAIPITAASPIIADLMERQTRNKVAESEMGYLGISYQNVTDQIVQMYGMPKGVYVVSVTEGSGAEAAGIVKGDVITKFDGNKISSYDDLQSVLQYYAVGDTVKVTVMRPENGEYVERELTLTLGERPATKPRR